MHPETYLIAAMTKDRVIGEGDQLPWHIPDDLKLFKRLTIGQTVIMGRKTFETIGNPLSDRHNIVLSGTLEPKEGITVCDSFMAGLAAAWRLGRPIYFIGGTRVFFKALEIVDGMHISWIKKQHQGNRFFPAFDKRQWLEVSREDHVEFRHIFYKKNP